MKKLSMLILLLLSLMAFTACGGAKLSDGTYTGEGKGNGGTLSVEVVVSGGKIAEVTIGDNKETPAMLEMVEATLPEQIIEKQGTDGVDTVSGATKTSEGVLEAVTLALEEAGK